MAKVEITIKGVSAELVLGSYMPKDATIFENWEEFYHYNDLIHVSQLMTNHVHSIEISIDGVDQPAISRFSLKEAVSSSPVFSQASLYLRTECVEEAVYVCRFEATDFDLKKLKVQSQDYDMLFKVSDSFIEKLFYDNQELELEWVSGKPLGNICLLCRYQNGYLVPVFDAIKKIAAQ